MAQKPTNCIKCLTIIETVFQLMNTLQYISQFKHGESISKDIVVRQAMRDICNIISGMERDSILQPISYITEITL